MPEAPRLSRLKLGKSSFLELILMITERCAIESGQMISLRDLDGWLHCIACNDVQNAAPESIRLGLGKSKQRETKERRRGNNEIR